VRAAATEPPDLSNTRYRLHERTVQGEFGAWRATDEKGNRYIVKPRWSEDGVAATELLRAEGYPVARYVLVRPGLSVQEELPGAPLPDWDALAPAMAARVIELNERLAGKRVPNAPPWPERIFDDVIRGHFYIDLDLLQGRSPELVRRCQRALTRAGDELTDPGDLVHWDFTTANILAVGNEVTGVVDWDGVCNGDRLFDLVTLFYYTRTESLRGYVAARITPTVFRAYLAAMVVRQVAYSLKFHPPEVGPGLIDDGLELMA
jgi:Ser/Thr protein kinase RdoA (MazF antagonist)